MVGRYLEGAAQVAPPLAGTEPGLLRSGPDPAQQPGVAGDAGERAKGQSNLFRLIEAAPPLAPPVQGDRNDGLGGIVSLQMVGQQAGEQRRQQDLARVFQPGNEQGVGELIVTYHLQPLPGRRPALAASAQQLVSCMVLWQGGRAQPAFAARLVQGVLTPAAQQRLVITGLATEQAEAEPVGPAAEDRTCFGEQPL
ncbi:hypothetical protein D3C77_72560 [compost metagenome]